MQLPNIKDLVLGDKRARFTRYQDGELWYAIDHDKGTFEFPISIIDAGGGAFLPEDKASTFMRWARKHLEYLQKAIAAEEAGTTS